MPNQFTQAEERGEVKPAGANQFTTGARTHHDSSTRDRMRAEKAAHKLERLADGEIDLTDKQIAACTALIPYGKPKLSSVESHETNEWDGMNENELLELSRALILQHPEIIQALNLIPNPAVVQQTSDIPSETTKPELIENTGT